MNDNNNLEEITERLKIRNILLKNTVIVTVIIIIITALGLSFAAIFQGLKVYQMYLFDYYIYYILTITFFILFISILEMLIKYRVFYVEQHLVVSKKNTVFNIDKDNFIDVMYFKRFYNFFRISICSIRFDFILKGKIISLRLLLSRRNTEIIYNDFIKLNNIDRFNK